MLFDNKQNKSIFVEPTEPKRTMLDYDDFDFQEFCEEEREIELQKQSSTPQTPQDYKMPTGAIVGTIIAIAVVVLMIVFSEFLVPIMIVGGVAYLFARWLLG